MTSALLSAPAIGFVSLHVPEAICAERWHEKRSHIAIGSENWIRKIIELALLQKMFQLIHLLFMLPASFYNNAMFLHLLDLPSSFASLFV